MNKSIFITIFIVISVLVIAFLIIIIKNQSKEIDTEIVKCIGNKSILYVQEGCHFCEKEINLFGDKVNYLNIVDCTVYPLACRNISSTPSWLISGKLYSGEKSIKELKDLTGCGYTSKITGVIR